MKYDFIVIGAGIVGLAVAREIKRRWPDATILVVEKEARPGRHASGRNSGVLHAGFYYSADSLKAKLTRNGNDALRAYCQENNLPLLECGKVVVAKNEAELTGLKELARRGEANNVPLELIDETELAALESNAKTFHQALYSPLTASFDPLAVLNCLVDELLQKGVEFRYATEMRGVRDGNLLANNDMVAFGHVVNAAGLYADQVARAFGYAKNLIVLPFKGLYLSMADNDLPTKCHVYPVPNMSQPFLGVHVTLTVHGGAKVGPTAAPAMWRESYGGLANFKISEALSAARWQLDLFLSNDFGFRRLAFEELRKHIKSNLIKDGAKLVPSLLKANFSGWSKPGIRAQLLDSDSRTLVQDFLIEGDQHSTHILNAVSPAFTCCFPFAELVVSRMAKAF